LTMPSRMAVIPKAKEMETRLLEDAEASLLRCTSLKLVQTPLVRNGLNPIVEIITALIEMDELPVRMLSTKQRKYLPFLRDLDYVKERNDIIVRANRFEQVFLPGDQSDESEMFNALIGEIAERGFPYLKTDMKITHLTPLLRTGNVFYYTSLINEGPIPLEAKTVPTLYTRYYGRRSSKGGIKTLTYIRELSEVGILEKEGRYLQPNADAWERFLERAPALT
ncbi:MAG: hypothetical protein L0Z54_05375, partial [Thermoplasmata archaeon]|nr:hypothetical protein [Thermoplasmata archaeon]